MLFRGLAVFVGGCTLATAEAVVGASGLDPGLDVVDGVASLVDKSLLRQEERAGDLRFRMLETIREYALERLAAAGETERFGRAHTEYYLGFAEQAEPGLLAGRQAEWLAWGVGQERYSSKARSAERSCSDSGSSWESQQ
ncbi:MAG TPA: hypothetical protein VMS64_15605 [Candidatus Methylomirabilis sp.]|nr:hypothetical protein [Candidatus Methylomirabilis sp.]